MINPESNRNEITEVDHINIITLIDNSADFLSATKRNFVKTFRQWTREQYGQKWVNTHFQLPIAEHGFSLLIRVLMDGKSHTILFDTGSISNGVIVNAKRMGVDLSEVNCVVISHGHYDHSGGLLASIKAINKVNLPIMLHEDVFKTRGTANPDGTIRMYPEFPSKEQMKSANLIAIKKPYPIIGNKALVTGEIPRLTSFEKGYLKHRALIDGSWTPDPWIWDDQAIVMKLKGKGLVVISGCAHAGIINIINYAKQLTGETNIYAVIGGFHLVGKNAENRTQKSIAELQQIKPAIIVAGHCTGWRAKCAMADNMSKNFVWNSVGNLYRF